MENVNGIIKVENTISNFGSIFATTGKKALFFTSLPFYWVVFFNYILNWFDFRLFAFVVIASAVMSIFGHSWGVIDWLAK